MDRYTGTTTAPGTPWVSLFPRVFRSNAYIDSAGWLVDIFRHTPPPGEVTYSLTTNNEWLLNSFACLGRVRTCVFVFFVALCGLPLPRYTLRAGEST